MSRKTFARICVPNICRGEYCRIVPKNGKTIWDQSWTLNALGRFRVCPGESWTVGSPKCCTLQELHIHRSYNTFSLRVNMFTPHMISQFPHGNHTGTVALIFRRLNLNWVLHCDNKKPLVPTLTAYEDKMCCVCVREKMLNDLEF